MAEGKVLAVLLTIASALLAGGAQEPPPLQELLRRAGTYLVDYTRQISAVVAEERYEQIARNLPLTTRKRLLRSDILVIAVEDYGWVGFRDVFEVDGAPVRNRDERLARLMLKPDANTLRQARRIADESARHNLSPEGMDLRRTSNMPMTALRFLWPPNQSRSTFKVERAATVDGIRTLIVEFRETARPRIISTADQAPARGRFWIEPETGRIVRSELSLTTRDLTITIEVAFALDPGIGLPVPVSMDEDYRVGQGDYLTVTGHATYSNFRKFSVDTSVIVKAP